MLKENVIYALRLLQVFFASNMCEKYDLTICKDREKRRELLNTFLQIENEVKKNGNTNG